MARHYVSNRWPSSPAELGQALADEQRFSELFPDAGPRAWEDFAAHYAEASPVVARMAAEAAQLELQQVLQAGGGRSVPRGTGAPAGSSRGRFYNKRAPGVPLDAILPQSETPLASFVRICDPRNETQQPLRAAFQNALSERVPSQGGLLVPEQLRSDLLQLSLEQAIIRPRCHVVQMDSLRVPYPAIDDTSHTASVYGGVIAFWTEESAALTQSAPSFARVILEARKLTVFTAIPNELMQDADAMLEDWLTTAWPAAIAYYEDDAFINGSGVGEPQGFPNAPAAIKVATASNNVILWNDIVSAYCRILPQALPGACWLMSPDTKKQLLELALTANSTTVAPPLWLSQLSAIGNEPSTLLGKPVYTSEKMPSSTSSNTTTAGALSLCNFSYFLLGDRSQMQLAMSQEYLFANDQTAWRLIQRCDAKVWPQSALSPRNGGATLSPFVLIDTTS